MTCSINCGYRIYTEATTLTTTRTADCRGGALLDRYIGRVHTSGLCARLVSPSSGYPLRRDCVASLLHVAPMPAHFCPGRAAYVSANPFALHQIAHGGRYGRGFLNRCIA